MFVYDAPAIVESLPDNVFDAHATEYVGIAPGPDFNIEGYPFAVPQKRIIISHDLGDLTVSGDEDVAYTFKSPWDLGTLPSSYSTVVTSPTALDIDENEYTAWVEFLSGLYCEWFPVLLILFGQAEFQSASTSTIYKMRHILVDHLTGIATARAFAEVPQTTASAVRGGVNRAVCLGDYSSPHFSISISTEAIVRELRYQQP